MTGKRPAITLRLGAPCGGVGSGCRAGVERLHCPAVIHPLAGLAGLVSPAGPCRRSTPALPPPPTGGGGAGHISIVDISPARMPPSARCCRPAAFLTCLTQMISTGQGTRTHGQKHQESEFGRGLAIVPRTRRLTVKGRAALLRSAAPQRVTVKRLRGSRASPRRPQPPRMPRNHQKGPDPTLTQHSVGLGARWVRKSRVG